MSRSSESGSFGGSWGGFYGGTRFLNGRTSRRRKPSALNDEQSFRASWKRSQAPCRPDSICIGLLHGGLRNSDFARQNAGSALESQCLSVVGVVRHVGPCRRRIVVESSRTTVQFSRRLFQRVSYAGAFGGCCDRVGPVTAPLDRIHVLQAH